MRSPRSRSSTSRASPWSASRKGRSLLQRLRPGIPAARALVMVDAAESLGGLSAERDLGLFDTRPALLLCSGFPVSKARATALADYGMGERTVRCVGEFFNGAGLLAEESAGTAAISSWLAAILRPPPPTAAGNPPGASAPERR